MNEKLDRLNEIKIENITWIIYIGIIILSFYANTLEKKFIIYNDNEAKNKYQNLIIIIFSILLIIYFYYTKLGYDDIKELNKNDSNKKIILTYASFIGSLLILISGIIFVIIAILDDELDIEIAFN